MVDSSFWRGRRVLVTGHTGFKGAWLTLWLQQMGAEVTGFSNAVPTEPSLFALARVHEGIDDRRGDVRRAGDVSEAFAARPEIVFHMAAQPFVRRSFRDPHETYETNVMGTVNVLDAVRSGDVAVTVNVTSDKCYDNREQGRPFVEDDPMGGHDPYSNSKGCAELVTDAYRRSYELKLASGRAGNVIGGGDWGEDRLIPDFVRGFVANQPVRIRNPQAIRPWQHVLNPLGGYLLLAQRLYEDPTLAGGWNFGPDLDDAKPVEHIADRFTDLWPDQLRWEIDPGPHPHEAQFLALDSTKAREQLGWRPRWDLDRTLERIVEWTLAWRDGADMRDVTVGQISEFNG